MRITSKGQVTIPIEVREKLGLLPNTEVDFEIQGRSVRLVRAAAKRAPGRGQRAVAALKGTGDVRMTTDQILRLTRGVK